ncbi:hypothetical protein [Rhodopirellula sp. MGV]|uniref:hypothetical protein n=1 Tax=Rhodopirellula sp. MGV TaxID=2023130 RepID=UPI0013045603|nr:hypothetical protein [Rhodopirellula sp. MGV]
MSRQVTASSAINNRCGVVAQSPICSPNATASLPTQYRTENRIRIEQVTKYRTETKTRSVNVTKYVPQTRTRTVEVTKYRTEQKTYRRPDGSTYQVTRQVPYTTTEEREYTVQVPVMETREETYEVQVPYTEEVEKSYQVKVPAGGSRSVAKEFVVETIEFVVNGTKKTMKIRLPASTSESAKEAFRVLFRQIAETVDVNNIQQDSIDDHDEQLKKLPKGESDGSGVTG